MLLDRGMHAIESDLKTFGKNKTCRGVDRIMMTIEKAEREKQTSNAQH
jgi:hypothetical protein